MNSPTQSYLSEVRARLEKATPGPWASDHCGDVYSTTATYKCDQLSEVFDYPCFTGFITTTRWAGDQPRANADLVANAPEDLAKLLAMVECLREGLEKTSAHAFNCMEGAGQPEFSEYDWICGRLAAALKRCDAIASGEAEGEE